MKYNYRILGSLSLFTVVLMLLFAITNQASAAESTTITPTYDIATLGSGSTVSNHTVTVAGGAGGVVFNFGMANAPSGVTPSFSPPSVTASGSSTLTLTIANTTPSGAYTINVQTNGVNAGTGIGFTVGNKWNGAGGDQNWSNGANWSMGSAPTLMTGALFDNNNAQTSTSVNNVVDSSLSVSNMIFLNTNATTAYFQNTRIASGQTLTLNNLFVGNDIGNGNPPVFEFGSGGVTLASISGSGGALSMLNHGLIFVGQGSATASGSHFALMDMSGLDNLVLSNNVTAIKIGIENPRSSSGTLFLARTNWIAAGAADFDPVKLDSGSGGGIIIGHNQFDRSNGTRVTNALYMGISNIFYINYFTIGRGDAVDIFAFNPVFVGGGVTPTAYIRGTQGDYVGVYVVGDNSPNGTNTMATNNFTGGIVDLAVTNLIVARGRDGGNQASTANGTLTFNAGQIIAQNLSLGFMYPSGSNSPAFGQVNVNGSGVLTVPGAITLTTRPITSPGGTAPAPQGTLNINGGTVFANIITNGGIQSGTATIGLSSGGILVVTNGIGTVGPVINNFTTANSTLRLNLNGGAVPVKVTSLTASGTSTIGIDSITGVTLPATSHIITYGAFFGSIANFTLGSLPAGYSGYLTNNTGNSSIDLVLSSSATSIPHFNALSVSGGNLTVSGTNGTGGGTFYVLTSTNLALPLSQWTPILTNTFDGSGNFSVTNAINPGKDQYYVIKQ